MTAARVERYYPRANPADFANIPEELKRRPQWLGWDQDKAPIDPLTGRRYPEKDPPTPANELRCSTFEQALECFMKTRNLKGLGFRFLPQDPYVGIDLDGCRDPETGDVAEWVNEQFAAWPPTYCEVSPSGTGIHLIVRAKIPHSARYSQKNGPKIELYPERRYFTITGQPFNGSIPTVAEAQEQVAALFAQLTGKAAEIPGSGDVPDFLTTASPLGLDHVNDFLEYAIKLPGSMDFEAELKKHGLKFKTREVNGGKSYDYHNYDERTKKCDPAGNGQPCLLAGVVHEANKRNVRCSRFFEKNGHVTHHCFDDDNLPSEEQHRTRKALAALGINLDGWPNQPASASTEKPFSTKTATVPIPTMRIYTPAELKASAPEPLEYVAHLIAARGMLTLIDGQPKTAGKTNLTLHGVRAVRQKEIFLGRPTKQVNVLLVTEENARTIILALERVGLLTTDGFYVVPWSSLAGQKWSAIIESVEKICVEREIGWLIADTFFGVAGLGGEEENKAGVVDAATVPLRHIIGRLNLAGTITRHERKSGGSVGESGRGSSALTGSVDAVVQLRRLSASYGPNVRQLDVSGRAEQVRLNVELVGDRYVVHEAGTDLRTSTLGMTGQLAEALKTKPETSIRDLAEFLGISRMRMQRLLSQEGWARGEEGWKRVDV